MKKNHKKDILKSIRRGIRLHTRTPQVFRDKNRYRRKNKHQRDDSTREQGY